MPPSPSPVPSPQPPPPSRRTRSVRSPQDPTCPRRAKAAGSAAPSESGSTRLAGLLLEEIASGRLPIGERLPSEEQLRTQYGVSRITVRESLSFLRGLGVIEGGQGSRRTVRPVSANLITRLFPLMVSMESRKTLHDVFAVRRALEPATAALAAVHRTPADLRRLHSLLDRHAACLLGVKDPVERQRRAIQIDLQFHLVLAQASGNRLFPILLESLSRFVTEVALRSCRGDLARASAAWSAHQRILQAVEAGDGALAAEEMSRHLEVSESTIPQT